MEIKSSNDEDETLTVIHPEVHLKWEIKNFFDKIQDTYEFGGRFLRSNYFSFKDSKWFLKFANRSATAFAVKITYHCLGPQNCQIDCTLGVLNSDGSINRTFRNLQEAPYHQQPPFLFSIDKEITTDKNILSKSGTFTLFCSLRLADSVQASPNVQEVSSQTSSLENLETLSKDFEQLFDRGRHSDVIFRVGTQEYPAHRSVLAARSTVLESMFSNDMLEKSSGVVNIIDCDERVFRYFLSFVYSGRLTHVPSENLASLYDIAEKYYLEALKVECAKRLAIEISVDLVCDVLHVAITYGDKDLLQTATDFFIANFRDILRTDQWETFIKKHTKFGTDLILKSMNN